MTESQLSETDLEAIFKHRKRVCPQCDSDSIVRSTTCIEDLLDGDPVLNGFANRYRPGYRCTTDGCHWFELDREYEGEHPERTKSTDPCPDRIIELAHDRKVSIQNENVELLGSRAIYRKENACPECGDDVQILLKRLVSEEDVTAAKTEISEKYVPIQIRCVNYGVVGGSCDHLR